MEAMYQLTWCTCMLGNYQSCTSAMLQLTVTLTVGETTICLLCWSYCLCREVASDGGEGSSPTLSSRNNCNDGTTGIVHVHTNHNMHVATGITHVHVYTNHSNDSTNVCICGFESHPRQLIFSRKSDCLGCAVLLCLVCLFDLACFFLSSFSSLIKTRTMYIQITAYMYHALHVHVHGYHKTHINILTISGMHIYAHVIVHIYIIYIL